MLAWFFLLVSMTWDGHTFTTYVGPFPSEASCQAMKEETAQRVMMQGWIQFATMEPCQEQEPK
jgi:hypothetical protein